jgi:hypothetical protein
MNKHPDFPEPAVRVYIRMRIYIRIKFLNCQLKLKRRRVQTDGAKKTKKQKKILKLNNKT